MPTRSSAEEVTARLSAAQAALDRCDWKAARAEIEKSLAIRETAQGLDLLGNVCWWLSDIDTLFASRERAYRLYVNAGDALRAARVATRLDWDYRAFRGAPAVANGWLRRARRLLIDLHDSEEYGWLLLREADAMLSRDAGEAASIANAAAALGRRTGSHDLEFLALSLEGLAMVTAGQVDLGMHHLDEATAAVVAGEFADPTAAGATCCRLIEACELVSDFDRAGQWCERVRDFCRRWDHPPLFAVCRTQYASVLLSQGSWTEAEEELSHAIAELGQLRPGWIGIGHLKLAELHRRQGRLDEAAEVFQRYERTPEGGLGLAAIALDRSQPDDSERLARRTLLRLSPGNHTARVAALELIVVAASAAGRPDRVAEDLAELTTLADSVDSDALKGSAKLAGAAVAVARHAFPAARDALDHAASLFDRAALPYDSLRARLLLAETLQALGQTKESRVEASAVAEKAGALGARELERRALALGALRVDRPATGASSHLTDREKQVLRQVARGLTNRQIAKQMNISEHTVHRHIANIFIKVGLSTRAAAVAFAVREGLD